jgi:ribonuclease HIII
VIPATDELAEAAAAWVSALRAAGISARLSDPIEHGIRAVVESDRSACRVNLYHSSKRGFSVVYAGGDRALAARVSGTSPHPAPEGPWPRAGSDEAGKGDYLGPLVAAAVCLDAGAAERLSRAGLADSKLLTHATITRLAGMVREESRGMHALVTIMPDEYNERMESLRLRGMNSLDMLAEAHGLAISRLLASGAAPESFVIDMFCSRPRLQRHLPPGLEPVLRTHAESDPPVAAAAVLARSEYMTRLSELEKRLGCALTPGAASEADAAARRVVALHGPDSLGVIAKLHFRNTFRVLGTGA